MIRVVELQDDTGDVAAQSVEYCGTDGEITALCCSAVRKSAKMRRVPVSRVLRDLEYDLGQFKEVEPNEY